MRNSTLTKIARNIGIAAMLLTMTSLNQEAYAVSGMLHVVPAGAGSCNAMGATQNQDGTYTFARLVTDSQGNIVDKSHPACIVKLLGFNIGWADSDHVWFPSDSYIKNWKKVVPWNVDRIAVNSRWWSANVPVPTQNGTPLQTVIDQMIQQNKANGIYTELDAAEQFDAVMYPPCGGNSNASCTPQNQADLDFAKNCQSYIQSGQPQNCLPWAKYEDMHVTLNGEESVADHMLTDWATRYGNDPSVIIDADNEPTDQNLVKTTRDQFFQFMNTRINIVHTLAPDTLIVVYAAYAPYVHTMPGIYPNGSNILMDYHIYRNKFSGTDFINQNMASDHMRNWGSYIDEFGGQGGSIVTETDLAELYSILQAGGVGVALWGEGKLLTNPNGQSFVLNDTGRMLCTVYSLSFNLSPQSCGSVPPGFPQSMQGHGMGPAIDPTLSGSTAPNSNEMGGPKVPPEEGL